MFYNNLPIGICQQVPHNCVRMQGRTVEKLRQSGNAVIEWDGSGLSRLK
jgi:hypothetical protein